MRRPIAALAVAGALFTGGAAFAEESGEMIVTIAGEEFTFPLWAGQSDWSGGASYADVSMYFRPTDEATWERYKSLTLSLSGASTSPGVLEATLSRMADGELQRLYSEDETGDLSVTVEQASIDGEFYTVSGTFAGAFGTSENFGRDIDLSDPVPVAGTFAVTVGPVE